VELEFISEEKMRRGIEDCRELVDARTAAEYDREWAGEIDACDFCGEKIQPDMEFLQMPKSTWMMESGEFFVPTASPWVAMKWSGGADSFTSISLTATPG
jgi:hypothetical protein